MVKNRSAEILGSILHLVSCLYDGYKRFKGGFCARNDFVFVVCTDLFTFWRLVSCQTLTAPVGPDNTYFLECRRFSLVFHRKRKEIPVDDADKSIFQENPDYEDLQKLPYLDWCVNEALRMHPSGIK